MIIHNKNKLVISCAGCGNTLEFKLDSDENPTSDYSRSWKWVVICETCKRVTTIE